MRGDVDVRPVDHRECERLLDLVRLSLGEGRIPREASYWKWKHESNPFGTSPGLVAESNGELVGLRIFMRWMWASGDRQFRSVRGVDTATHPDWRGRGIFSRLTLALCREMEADGVGFGFSTPNAQSRPGLLKMGWSSLGRTSLRIRLLKPLQVLRSRIRRSDDAAPEPGGAVPVAGASVAALVQEEGLPDLLIEASRADGRLSTPLSVDYLRWRYAEIPGFEYRCLWQIEGAAQAAVIFRVKDQTHLRELRVCEMVVAPNSASRKAGRALLNEVLAGNPADYAAGMAASSTPESSVLTRSGFVPAPRVGPILTVRRLAGTPAVDPIHRRNWRLSIGDLELF